MSLTITYDSNFSSYDGLQDYFTYYETTYSETTHAANMTFADGPGSDLDIGDETYSESYYYTQVIGSDLANTMTSESDVSFLIAGETVTLEDSSGTTYSSDDMIYTGGTSPSHTLAGAIDTLTFGDGAYSSGSLASDLFAIDGLYEAIGNGMLDNDSDGAYDEIIDRNSATDDNDVHDLINGLMSGDTSTLETILNANDITHNGTSVADTFDAFSGQDEFVLSGGDDLINAGFQVGSGGDVINIDGINSFADAAAAVTAVDYSTGNAVLTYYEGFIAHTVEITGVSSGLTTDNFVV
ncbi:hypothetical protein Q4551_09140 [Oceanobacter sp. 5_MG-2023]|uniref:hypothetical protein n=1 Tax=Oceanobacter sp. 5_MG-2023 TaxID=3062645 RepID=UPI0026E1F12F|nr:hypothetical protein [Oceanobacter sp. 5_MG-2023]MDO6682454.1 hypothetical protein [Oceanobacter sp. 5_MG-2023]